jgi:hypothetical protein
VSRRRHGNSMRKTRHENSAASLTAVHDRRQSRLRHRSPEWAHSGPLLSRRVYA